MTPSATTTKPSGTNAGPGSYPSATKAMVRRPRAPPDDGSTTSPHDQHDAAGASSRRSAASASNALACGCHQPAPAAPRTVTSPRNAAGTATQPHRPRPHGGPSTGRGPESPDHRNEARGAARRPRGASRPLRRDDVRRQRSYSTTTGAWSEKRSA